VRASASGIAFSLMRFTLFSRSSLSQRLVIPCQRFVIRSQAAAVGRISDKATKRPGLPFYARACPETFAALSLNLP
jgi:hypothetical protein